MKRGLLSLLLVSLCLLLVASLLGQPSQQKVDFTELEKTILQELKETNTPGVAIAITSGDRVIFSRGFGTSNVETNAPVTTDMLFRIGSMTKMFTAATLLGLTEEGKIKLDDPIGNYVKGLSAKLAQLTAHQLLTHTAGLRDEARPFGLHDEAALANTVRSWKDDYLFTEPGKIFSYSNSGFALLGLVIEESGAKPYADQLVQRLFKPLGMTFATFRPTVAMTYPMAQGHNASGNAKPTVIRPFTDNVANWPAGFMFANANDLARFAIAFLNAGKIDGKPVLSPALINKLSTPYVAVPGFNLQYAYGLRVQDWRGVRVIEHGGAIPGFGSEIKMVPEHRFAIIVLGNKSAARFEKSVEKAMALMLPLKAQAQNETRTTVPMSEAEMMAYAGVYANGNRFELVSQEGKLFLKQRNFLFPISKFAGERFVFKTEDGDEDFVILKNAEGRAEYLHIDGRAYKKVENR